MELFGSKGEHHETPCPARDDGGPAWVRKDRSGRPNPMGWGSDEPRTVKRAGKDARSEDSRPKSHESRSEKVLLSGAGSLIRHSGERVPVTGDRPGGRQRRRP